MFACLCVRATAATKSLQQLAGQFSPLIELVGDDAVVFSVSGLERLLGDVHAIASAISQAGNRLGIDAALALAANAATAILVARSLPGVNIVYPGREAEILAPLPIGVIGAEPELNATLARWGLRTVGDFAALPEAGVRERLGEEGCRLRRLTLGCEFHLLKATSPEADYASRQTFDDPIELLEPLLFIISAQLRELTNRLEKEGRAADQVTVTLGLDRHPEFQRTLQLPIAVRDPMALLKQIQLSLEASPPQAPILSVAVTLNTAEPRILQGGLFVPATPEPEKLQTLLARLRALVGEGHVGSPELLNTHRPDAYRIRDCAFEPSIDKPEAARRPMSLSLRMFRPPVVAHVRVVSGVPLQVESARVSGKVIQAAGPWPTSGEWWTSTVWDRREWDVVLDDRDVYRMYETSGRWYLEGTYD